MAKARMRIRGGKPLFGRVAAQGAKNAALPVIASSLLLKGKRLTLERVPDLQDIHTMAKVADRKSVGRERV